MATLQDLKAQRDALEEQIASMTQEKRSEAIAQVRALMEEHGLEFADIGAAPKAGSKPAAKSALKGNSSVGSKVAAKYRDATGNTWSGRGLKPKWLQAEIEGGKKIEEFAV